MSKKLRKLLNLSFVLPLLIGTAGCFDIGLFGEEGNGATSLNESNYEEYYKAYYDAIGDLILYSQDESDTTYNLKDDFFNKDTVQKLDCNVPENEYICMAFEIKKDINIEALSMYVKANDATTSHVLLDVYLYKTDTTSFSKLCPHDVHPLYLEDDDGEYIYDIYGNKAYCDFDLPDKSKAIGSASLNVIGSEWSSFTISKFNNEKVLEVKKDDCLVVCFYNNTGYQRGLNEDAKDASQRRKQVKIKLTNLIIRAN